jgi:hypothetical protein
MHGKHTIAGQIEALIQRLQGVAICDDCITERLNLSVRSQANVVTRGLGGHQDYRRSKAPCGLCEGVKTVIHRKTS